MFNHGLAVTVFVVFGAFVNAQAPAAKVDHGPRGDLYGGFWYVSSDSSFSGTSSGSDLGWKVGGDAKVYQWLSFAGEFAMGSGTVTNAKAKTYTGLVGPRVAFPLGRSARLTPFARALFGGTQVSIAKSADARNSAFEPTFSLDGGADFQIAGRLSWRGQFGYLYNTRITLINDEVQNVPNPPAWHLQVFTGPVFRF
jgi:hypothetical protein